MLGACDSIILPIYLDSDGVSDDAAGIRCGQPDALEQFLRGGQAWGWACDGLHGQRRWFLA